MFLALVFLKMKAFKERKSTIFSYEMEIEGMQN